MASTKIRTPWTRLAGSAGSQGVAARSFSQRLKWSCPLLLALLTCRSGCAQTDLPDAPTPQGDLVAIASSAGGNDGESSAADPAAGQQTFPPAARPTRGANPPGLQPNYMPLPQYCIAQACTEATPSRTCCQENSDDFADYLKQNALHIYSPRELGRLAIHGIIDPFNLLTIGGTSVISVATDSHSPFGPGVEGWAKLSGVTLTQDMTSEFFGTFLIPAIDHQDPHYHRLPNASLKRRIAHCLYQPFWTESDTGKDMVNYSTIVGTIADEAVGITYVPYQQVGWGASAERIASAWYTAPIGNFVTEFVPDVARHVNFRVVFIQRIVNQVASEEGAGSSSP
jgi:hypothetical protein